MNKQIKEAAERLYNYIGDYANYTIGEFEETIENDWEQGYLTDYIGNDDEYYLWYKDECKIAAIRVDDGEIFTYEKQICDIMGIAY